MSDLEARLVAAEAQLAAAREALEEWNDFYPEIAQLVNGWSQGGGDWSEWDEQVRQRLIAAAAKSRAALGEGRPG